MAPESYNGGSVSPLLRFYYFFHYSIHFTLGWSPIHVLTVLNFSDHTGAGVSNLVYIVVAVSNFLTYKRDTALPSKRFKKRNIIYVPTIHTFNNFVINNMNISMKSKIIF